MRRTSRIIVLAMTNDRAGRVLSIDIVRGAVMVLMAIDHVRVYAGVPAGGPQPAVFFTRWVTHFCAPAFVFLAGASAFLYGRKVDSRAALARFLLIRGVWLVPLELTLLRFGWTFNFDYASFTFAGVIWVIGWSMIALAALVFLPTAAVAAIGVTIMVGHNAFAGFLGGGESPSWIRQLLYAGGEFAARPGWLFANYPMRPPDVPEGYRWSLALLYLVTAIVVWLLYFPCRRFAELKTTKRSRWMSFL